MQIEEAFRDLKNTRNGFSLRHNRSVTKARLEIALLVGSLAIFLLMMIGFSIRKTKLAYSFQANTCKTQTVLSYFTLGWQYLQREGPKISVAHFFESIQAITLEETV